MTEHEMVKVYELAKELGIDSMSLLDKLKDLKIEVKNHMSELKFDELQIARHSLTHKTASKKTATTKVKKKLAKTTKPSLPKASIKAAESSLAEKRTASPVIRRRIKNENNEEHLQINSSLMESEKPLEQPTNTECDEVHSNYAEKPDSLEKNAIEKHTKKQESLSPPELFNVEKGQPSLQVHESLTHDVAQAPTPEPSSEESLLEEASTAKKLKPTRPPIVLTPRPVAPRRSILKIVEATPPPQKPIIKPTSPSGARTEIKATVKGITTHDKDGFRIIKMTKENLDQMVEEEAAKKRGGGRVFDLRPEDVRFADYRKKELIFLPKKKKIPIGKEIKKTEKTVAKAQKRIILLKDAISVQDLANQLSIKATEVIRKLISMGQMTTLHQTLDLDTATLIANEYQYEVKNTAFNENEWINLAPDESSQLQHRPPIVTIMGHVDHGKTTLLDSIRKTNIVGKEAGGITQHIGAYTIEKEGKHITFIDTPGHEAFTIMRARGANVTDIVVLVVSADDGVMPQTREAISHAQAAKVPIIIAVNKIDKPGANPEKIKQGLSELNLLSEDWGGETVFISISALKKTNLDKLLDAILLQAEMLDLKANPNARATGTILETRLEKGRGAIVSVLINRGTLRIGDPILSASFAGKVKALNNDKGEQVKSAKPGTAVEILGFEGLPSAGELFHALETEAQGRSIVENRINQTRVKAMNAQEKVTLEDLFSKIQSGHVKDFNVVLKTDTFGSTEAIRESLLKLSRDKIKIKIILAAPGGITESDIALASASKAVIIGFNVRPETKARQLAEMQHIEIKCYSIIYELLDEVKKAMVGVLDKKKVEKFLGRAEVRQVFVVPKIGAVGGSFVIDGKILRGASIRLLRDSRIIFEGKMTSLKRFKDDAKEVASGFECGIGIENYNDLKIGDIIESFQIDLITPELEE